MQATPLDVRRHGDRFQPDASRVLLRPFIPVQAQRLTNIIGRVMSLTEGEAEQLLDTVMAEFNTRHVNIERVFERHYTAVRASMFTDREPSRARRLLLGSYFTAEYALESAALFNPSIVPHPDQAYVPPGWIRFIMSFRATGEGHISSIEFRTGIVNDQNEIVMDRCGRYVTEAMVVPNPTYAKALFERKLQEMGFDNRTFREVIGPLEEEFTLSDLKASVKAEQAASRNHRHEEQRTRDAIVWLAESNYEIRFDPEQPISERVIFPYSSNESNGIEDARFVRFVDDEGEVTWHATYTAYNGKVILPQILSTSDFLTFQVVTLNGKAVENKGMALFPRKIRGRYAMISRQDNENLFLMYSDHLHFWQEMEKIVRPSYPWEFVQMGNCGSPLETEAGWILLTHGVGPMRKYCIGAVLLDRDDPSRVIGRLREPLLAPNENEREGYVPNVVYTCGALIHNRQVIIPYAMSDSASSICTVSLDELLAHLQPAP
jgi:predicted GH43/DUF377 family glycosyl hydrolase